MPSGEDVNGGFETGTVSCRGVAPLPYEKQSQSLNIAVGTGAEIAALSATDRDLLEKTAWQACEHLWRGQVAAIRNR